MDRKITCNLNDLGIYTSKPGYIHYICITSSSDGDE